jgi:hypothetical protein
MCPPEQETQMRFGLGNVIGPIFGGAGEQATAFPAGSEDRGETMDLLIGDVMLRPKAQLNLRNAREYFREHLCVGDYYSEGQKIAGEWFGQAAYDLGLSGAVGEKEFLALCEGRNPQTGKWLTQRHNTVRHEDGHTAANRRIFHDFHDQSAEKRFRRGSVPGPANCGVAQPGRPVRPG